MRNGEAGEKQAGRDYRESEKKKRNSMDGQREGEMKKSGERRLSEAERQRDPECGRDEAWPGQGPQASVLWL